jgi:hypothetical protein
MSFISFAELAILLVDLVYQIWKFCRNPLRNRREAKANNLERIEDKLENGIFVSIVVSLINCW